ncbi:MAG: biofilm regulation protein kinase SiaB [Rhodoferax sp.]
MHNQPPPIDLLAIREMFNRQNILLCFNGPVTAPLIEEIGKAFRKHMEGLQESPSSVTDVFSVYIEMAQNIRRYAQAQAFESESASIIISRDASGSYAISASNVVRVADGQALIERIGHLAGLDKDAMKAAFKTQLRQPRTALAGSAGLGLIDMARKATAPLQHSLQNINNEHSLFNLRVML